MAEVAGNVQFSLADRVRIVDNQHWYEGQSIGNETFSIAFVFL